MAAKKASSRKPVATRTPDLMEFHTGAPRGDVQSLYTKAAALAKAIRKLHAPYLHFGKQGMMVENKSRLANENRRQKARHAQAAHLVLMAMISHI